MLRVGLGVGAEVVGADVGGKTLVTSELLTKTTPVTVLSTLFLVLKSKADFRAGTKQLLGLVPQVELIDFLIALTSVVKHDCSPAHDENPACCIDDQRYDSA